VTVDNRIIQTLSPLAPVNRDEIADKTQPGYTFNYDTLPIAFSSNAPAHERYLIQVHLFCPEGCDSLQIRNATKQVLFKARFSWPAEVDAGLESESPGDATLQHYVYECERTERVVIDGGF